MEAMNTTIEVCASVHQFQRRFCWMLSSLLQQRDFDLHRLRVCAAYIEGTGKPTTCQVLEFFSQEEAWQLHHVPYPDHTIFQRRGNVRNRHVAEAEADWMLFTDADMIFPPNFMHRLMEALDTEEYRSSNACLYTGRFSTTLAETEALVDIDPERYPCVIPDAWKQTIRLPAVRKSNIGAGFCQVVRTAFLRERGYYIPPGKAADWDWSRHSKCKSDHQFRREVGRKALPPTVPWLYHLQHQRDKEHGHHIDLQR